MIEFAAIAELVPGWLLTLALHSALLAAATALTLRLAFGPRDEGASRGRVLKFALFAPLLSSFVLTAAGAPWASWAVIPEASSGRAPGAATPLAALGAQPVLPRLEAAGPRALSTDPSTGLESVLGASGSTPQAPSRGVLLAGCAAVLLSISALRILGLVGRSRRFVRSLHRRPLEGHEEARELGRARLNRDVRITVSRQLEVPTVLSAEEVCLPEGCWEALSPASRDALLAHEFAHLERRDPLWFRMTACLEAGLYFLPWVKALARHFRRAAEFDCDDRAAEWTGSRVAMARCLSEVATWRREQSPYVGAPYALPAMDAESHGLVARVEHLVESGPASKSAARRSWLAAFALGALACSAPVITAEGEESTPGEPSQLEASLPVDGDIVVEVDADGHYRARRSAAYPEIEPFNRTLDSREAKEALVLWLRRAVEPLPKSPYGTENRTGEPLEITEGTLAIVATPDTRFREVQRVMSLGGDMEILMPDVRFWMDGAEYRVPLPRDEGVISFTVNRPFLRALDVRVDMVPGAWAAYTVTGLTEPIVVVPEEILEGEEEPGEEPSAPESPVLRSSSFSELQRELPMFIGFEAYAGARIDARQGTTVRDVARLMDLLGTEAIDTFVFTGSYER